MESEKRKGVLEQKERRRWNEHGCSISQMLHVSAQCAFWLAVEDVVLCLAH